MPHFHVTPWRDSSEIIKVRSQFYPPASSNTDERRQAIDLVRAWKIRGNLPHAVESTALLVDAVLNDTHQISPWCVRAAYSTAFTRFVTGFVDTSQTGKFKRSMYLVAQDINMPASFVELRHQATHEELPPVTVLRQAARRSLVWLWDYYWKRIDERKSWLDKDAEASVEGVPALNEALRAVLKPYMKKRIEEVRKKGKTTTYEDDITDIACKNCVRICRGDAEAIGALASVLSDTKFLIPSNRTLAASLKPAFNIWDSFLQSFTIHQRPFLSALLDELLVRLTLPSNLDVSLDTYREAIFFWLVHILTDASWASARKRGRPDLDCVVATCLMGQNVWSLRLAEIICGIGNGTLKNHWGDLVSTAVLARDSETRCDAVAGSSKTDEQDVVMYDNTTEREENGEGSDASQASSNRMDDDDNDSDGPGWQFWKGPWIAKPIGMI